jgi:acyl-coenzyme A synthetase/AMP-(fatty) acid ligase
VRDGAARLRHVITIGEERRPWARPLDDLLAEGSSASIDAPAGLGGSMVYTAGTTGKPKGARRNATDPGAVLPRLAALRCVAP